MAEWCCQQTGDCCRRVGSVVMTRAERAELPADIGVWRERPDGFQELMAAPCPFLDLGTNRCTVYPVRPYNCRRWGCFRELGEALTDLSPVPLRVLKSPAHQATWRRMEGQGQVWARAHGWRDA